MAFGEVAFDGLRGGGALALKKTWWNLLFCLFGLASGPFSEGLLGGPSDDRPLASLPGAQRNAIHIGDGFPNGGGASLGRLFLEVRGLPESPARTVPLELALTSSQCIVESEGAGNDQESCRGVAAVAGNATTQFASVWGLKLAAAGRLPLDLPPELAGVSLECALAGSLTVAGNGQPGSPVRLRLAQAELPRLLAWAGDGPREPRARPFETGTGSGLLLEDIRAFLCPGQLEGQVLASGPHTILLRLDSAGINLLDARGADFGGTITADPEAAAAAGLPAGAFGLLEINRTGFPTPSLVFPEARSDDVEITLTPPPEAPVFLRGDCDGDGEVIGTVSDAIALLNFSFNGGPAPPCFEACDANADGVFLGEVSDITYLLGFNFFGTPPPPPPFPACESSHESVLGCEASLCASLTTRR